MKEARASLLGLTRAGRREEERGCVVLSVSDNLAEVLATEKGRSKDKELNTILRRSAGTQELYNQEWRRRHIQCACNLADFDSRHANRGLLRPGECVHPRALVHRASRRHLHAAPLLGPHPPSLLDADLFATLLDEKKVDAARSKVPRGIFRRALKAPAFLEVFWLWRYVWRHGGIRLSSGTPL